MAYVHAAQTDDDGTNTTGTVWNNAFETARDALLNAYFMPLAGVTQTTTSTGTQNDFALTAGAKQLRCNNASLLTLTGLAAGVDGQRLVIVSTGAGQVDIANNSASSAAANRVLNGVTATISLVAGLGRALLAYDGSTAIWRVIAHEQGDFITPTFSAGNFTGSGTITWTVDAGDVTAYKYKLEGRKLTVILSIQTTTVSGTGTELRIAVPGGFSVVTGTANATIRAIDNGTARAGNMDQTSTYFRANLDMTATANWAASTNATYVIGTITCQVS